MNHIRGRGTHRTAPRGGGAHRLAREPRRRSGRHAQPPRWSRLAAAGGCLAVVACGTLFLIRPDLAQGRVPPPTPAAGAAARVPMSAAELAAANGGHPLPAALGPSLPILVEMPRIGLHAAIVPVGLAADGSIAVPNDDQAQNAGWYDEGPAPGQTGPAVLLGHVDSWSMPLGRAAFYTLGAARPGDAIDVTRSDGEVATFTVDSVRLVPKSAFPTNEVYGHLDYAGLRLITCGGSFSSGSGYQSNVVVFAHLSGTRHL